MRTADLKQVADYLQHAAAMIRTALATTYPVVKLAHIDIAVKALQLATRTTQEALKARPLQGIHNKDIVALTADRRKALQDAAFGRVTGSYFRTEEGHPQEWRHYVMWHGARPNGWFAASELYRIEA